MNNGRDCAHGRQVGKCDTCELIEAEKEIEALKAQVEQLRSAIDSSGAYKTNQALSDALLLTPAQCLAEVRAQAVDDALRYANEKSSTYLDVDFYIMEYANQLSQQSTKQG